MITTKQEPATGSNAKVSSQVTAGNPIAGSPPGTGPMSAMPCSAKPNMALAAIVPTTAMSATGTAGAKRWPSRMLAATSADSKSVGMLNRVRASKISHA